VDLRRPAWLIALVLLVLGLLLGSPRAHAAPAQAAHAHARHAVRCGGARTHGRAGSVRQTHRPTRAHRRRCRRRHLAALRRKAAQRRAAERHRRATARARRGRSRLAGPDGLCQDSELRPSEQNLERIRAATLCLVNRERADHGERALQPNSQLRQAAQGHTDSMVEHNYFEHVGPGGQTPLQRLRDAGYIYSSRIGYEIGENIAWGSGALGTPRAIVAAWMASPGHRANILDPHYRDTAIGVAARLPASAAHGQLGGIYTQDFGVIITA
jgi:uncharacterized protein YkwD